MSGLFNQASLVLVPSGYKSGKVYSQIPTDGDGDLTFTRASDATRVNSDGLIEKVRTNLALYSEQFDNAEWSKLNGGIGLVPTVTANTAISPSGFQDADRIQLSLNGGTSGSDISYISQAVSTTAATFSIYAKSNTTPCTIYFRNGSTVTTINITTEWKRFELYSSGAITLIQFGLRGGSFGGALNSNTADISVWGAQLETGDIATDYIPTTTTAVSVGMTANVPRLDYSGGGCPKLLLEPQRTNSFLNADWTGSVAPTSWTLANNNGTITKVSSSLGIGSNALSFANTGGGSLNIEQSKTFTASTHTISFYVESITGVLKYEELVRLAGGPVITTSAFFLNGASVLASDQVQVGRVEYRFTLGTGDLHGVRIGSGTGATNPAANTLVLSRPQVELGSYATSYIPTTSATVTRLADSFTRDNIYTNGLITSSGGTWVVELKNNVAYRGDAVGDGIFLRTTGDTDNFRFYSDNSSTNRIYIFKRVSNVNSQLYVTATDTVKIAIKWNGTTADIFVNGTKVVSATSFTATQLQEITTSITAVPKFIQQMALYPTPLTDAECIELTTL